MFPFYFPAFTFLIPAHPSSPRQSPGGHKTVVVVHVSMPKTICV